VTRGAALGQHDPSLMSSTSAHVRWWHKTDIPKLHRNVRYQGISRPSSDATDSPL
jgi:hypothetical protein